MSVQLFKSVNGYIESRLFPPERLQALLEDGWSVTPDDELQTDELQTDELQTDELQTDLESLKEEARALGVNSWHRYKDPAKLQASIDAKKAENFM